MALGVGVGDGLGAGVALGSGVGEGVEPLFELSGSGVGPDDSSESGPELSGEDGTTAAARVAVGVGSPTLFESGFDSGSPPPQPTRTIERDPRARIKTMRPFERGDRGDRVGLEFVWRQLLAR